MSEGSDCDVIVIGSGPAGIAAAITCFQAGLKVVIITTASCTSIAQTNPSSRLRPLESFHPGIVPLLTQLYASAALEPAVRSSYSGIHLGEKFTALGADETGPWLGYHVDRNAFDKNLLQIAKNQGIPLLENEKVVNLIRSDRRVTGVTTATGKTITAPWTVDGSGRQRIAGKRLQYQEQYFSAPLIARTGLVTRDPVNDYHTQTRFISHQGGWSWIVPCPPNRLSWTIVRAKDSTAPDVPAELAGCGMVGGIQSFNVRWRVFRPLAGPGIVLCGDAAGIIDPAYGQGVFSALLSGISAAHCAVACIRDRVRENLFIARYDDWFMRQYEEKCHVLRGYYKENKIKM